MRTSTADRERAVDVLKAAFAEGRLDQAEYEDRVGLVYSSRTYAELAALTGDLPVGPLGTLAIGPPPPAQPWQPAPHPAPWQVVPWQPPGWQAAPWQAQPWQAQPWQAPPGQPVPWPPPPPPPVPAPRPTNGAALAALLFGLASFLTRGVLAPVAIALAIVAASKIRRSGEAGAGLAAAGLALGLLSLMWLAVLWP